MTSVLAVPVNVPACVGVYCVVSGVWLVAWECAREYVVQCVVM
jgi:hypothetical protein